MMPTPRKPAAEPVPCMHTRVKHQHGTRAAYVADHCPCPPCRAANRAYENNRSRQALYGRWAPFVDAAPAREHVRACMAAGLGTRRICAISGVSRAALVSLLYGTQRTSGPPVPATRIRPETAERLLAVQISTDNLAGGVCVDAIGTRRRLQALVAIGWSRAELGRRIGVTPQNFTSLLATGQVTVRTAAAVRALYDALSMQPRSADDHPTRININRARHSAAAAGWVPPLAWDDEDIDDPAARPAQASRGPRREGAHALTAAEREELVRSLHRQQCSDRQIADRTGMSGRTVLRIRGRLGLPAVAA
jgi:DNA-binding CsgD family transcriptional regulator/DNA-binding Xre family transcriptional regulator